MTVNSPFHPGELEIQQWLGVQAAAAKLSPVIQSSVPVSAFDFIRRQTGIWLGIDDREGLLWAFPLQGLSGFINPNDGRLLNIALHKRFPVPEPWLTHVQQGKAVGCLLIDLASRRRLRINGTIKEINADLLQVTVQQAYPNCQKYISARNIPVQSDGGQWRVKATGTVLDEPLQDLIKQADTAFVASLGPNGADVSHRGGPGGFISCLSDDKISVPDYQGNNLFNTLGNFKTHPVAGLTIVEFEQGLILQLSGHVEIIVGRGADRRWELAVKQWRLWQYR